MAGGTGSAPKKAGAGPRNGRFFQGRFRRSQERRRGPEARGGLRPRLPCAAGLGEQDLGAGAGESVAAARASKRAGGTDGRAGKAGARAATGRRSRTQPALLELAEREEPMGELAPSARSAADPDRAEPVQDGSSGALELSPMEPAVATGAADGGRRLALRETAHSLAAKQREISISEFFTKNRHLLGFDNPQKALLTAVKEAVDNALDACEEAGILPESRGRRSTSSPRTAIGSRVQDNGPGIVRAADPEGSSASCSTARNSTACGRRAASRGSASPPPGCTAS